MATDRNPGSLKEALSQRRRSHGRPRMGGLAMPGGRGGVLELSDCEEFRRIDTDGSLVHIGAGATAVQLSAEPLIPELLRYCAERCPEELRSAASLGGAICSGCGEVLCTLEALDASVTLASESGRRTMPLRLFRKRGMTLSPDELLCEILVPCRGKEEWILERSGRGLCFAGTLLWERRRLSALRLCFVPGPGELLRYPEFERQLLGLTRGEAKELRKELLDSYRVYWSGNYPDSAETLIRRAELFLSENGI